MYDFTNNKCNDEIYNVHGDLLQVDGFLWILQLPPHTKTDCHNITEILLLVALNTITITLQYTWYKYIYVQCLYSCREIQLIKMFHTVH